jgi:hypothetical protein
MSAPVGSGRGTNIKITAKIGIATRKEIVLASHGFRSDALSCAFIELPNACKIPERMIRGNRYAATPLLSQVISQRLKRAVYHKSGPVPCKLKEYERIKMHR